MIVSTLYLCNATIGIIENNKASAEHTCRFFSDGSSNVIFICVSSLSYFKYTFQAPNFYFKEPKKCLFEKIFKGRRKLDVTNRIQTVNLIGDKRCKYLEREIILGHCPGHNTIVIFFYIKGFYDQLVRYLSENYYFR